MYVEVISTVYSPVGGSFGVWTPSKEKAKLSHTTLPKQMMLGFLQEWVFSHLQIEESQCEPSKEFFKKRENIWRRTRPKQSLPPKKFLKGVKNRLYTFFFLRSFVPWFLRSFVRVVAVEVIGYVVLFRLRLTAYFFSVVGRDCKTGRMCACVFFSHFHQSFHAGMTQRIPVVVAVAVVTITTQETLVGWWLLWLSCIRLVRWMVLGDMWQWRFPFPVT